jgi:hypothetical protein
MNAIFLALLMAATPSFEAKTLNGQTVEGTLSALDADHLDLKTSEGPVSLKTDTLLRISLKQKAAAAKNGSVCVELIDGSMLFGQQYTAHDGQAILLFSDSQKIKLPLRSVLTVRFQRDSDALGAEWVRIAGMKRDSDLLVVRKDEVLDYHKGALQNVDEDTVQFNVDGEVLPVKRGKVYGLAYHHPTENKLPSAICRITDASGSQWAVQAIGVADQLQWTTPTGLKMSLPLEKVTQIDFSSGKLAYLSDMQAENVRWTPFFGGNKMPAAVEQFYIPRQDRNFDGDSLQLDGVSYSKGVAVQSRTELTYRIPEGFNRFLAVVGIDDDARPNGKVKLVIRDDTKVLLDTVIAGSDASQPIDLDIAGVRRLVILVDFADTTHVGNHLLLCNARITK